MPVTLAELAIHIPASMQLFEKYDLDYYQNVHQLFREACEEKGLSFTEMDAELTELQNSTQSPSLTLEDMSLERLKSLKEFETDLHMHLHIENNILFPKIKELEEELNKTVK